MMCIAATKSHDQCEMQRPKSTIKKALVLPYRTEYSFQCFVCLQMNDDHLDSIWKFIPFYESRLYNIRRFTKDNEKIVEIDRSGRLVQRNLQKSGTFYCINQTEILAIYRVTILQDFQRKTFKYIASDKHDPNEPIFKEYHIVYEDDYRLQIFFHQLYETECNKNRYYSLGQTVFICMVRMVNKQTSSTINDDNESQLIHKLKEFSEIPCADPLIDQIISKNFRKQFLSNVRIVISYKVCQNMNAHRFRKEESKLITFMHMKSMFQSTEHLKRKILDYTVISCFRL